MGQMNWSRVRQDKLMAAVAGSDRIAEAAGATPMRHEELPPEGRAQTAPSMPARQARQLKKLEDQIRHLRAEVGKAERHGDRKAARKLARRALSLLEANGIRSLTPDRVFFQKAAKGPNGEAHRVAVAKTGRHAKGRQRIVLGHVYKSELRESVQAAGGIFTPTGKSIKVTSSKGSALFPAEKLAESDAARREVIRQIVKATGLRLRSLNW